MRDKYAYFLKHMIKPRTIKTQLVVGFYTWQCEFSSTDASTLKKERTDYEVVLMRSENNQVDCAFA